MAEGDFDHAQGLLKEALRQIQSAKDLDSLDLAAVWTDLGTTLRRQGDLPGAESYMAQAIPLWQRMLGPDDPSAAGALGELANLRLDQGGPVRHCRSATACSRSISAFTAPTTGHGDISSNARRCFKG
jgi:tetratricopeptide (TPR) repeat protein